MIHVRLEQNPHTYEGIITFIKRGIFVAGTRAQQFYEMQINIPWCNFGLYLENVLCADEMWIISMNYATDVVINTPRGFVSRIKDRCVQQYIENCLLSLKSRF